MTLAEIRARHRNACGHFFDDCAMRFFDSTVECKTFVGVGGVYFVTSEQFHSSTGYSAPRAWTVRRFNPNTAEIDTVGDFNTLTRSQAFDRARRLAAGGVL